MESIARFALIQFAIIEEISEAAAAIGN